MNRAHLNQIGRLAVVVCAALALASPARAAEEGWQPGTPSLIERAEGSAAVIGGSIYVVGGLIGPTTTNQVERYDVAHDRWQLVKPMPIALNHPSAVAYGGDLYVVGGYTNGISTPGVPTGGLLDTSNAFLRYDPRSDSWSEMPSMPVARSAAAAAIVGDRLYVAGGRERFPTYATSEGLLARLDVFDFATGSWSRGPDMTIAREHVAGATAARAFYVIGGRTVLDSIPSVERYLPSESRWERVADMRVPHNGLPAVTLGDRIVVFGGEEPSNAQLKAENEATELFDPATGRWSDLPDMRTPRGGHAGAVVGRRVYAIAGIPRAPLTTAGVFTNLVETLDLPVVAPPGQAQRRSRPRKIQLSVQPQRARAGRRTRFRFRATTSTAGRRRAVGGAAVHFAGGAARTDRRGRAALVRTFRRPGRYRATATKRGLRAGAATVRVLGRAATKSRLDRAPQARTR